MKRCSKCGMEKDFSDFHKHSTGKDGHRTVCKQCKNLVSNQYYYDNKEEIINKQKEYSKIYQKENKESVNKKSNQWRKKNIEKWRQIKKDQVEKLNNNYARRSLVKKGWPKEVITEDLIELNKSIIKIKRYVKSKTSKESI